MIAAWTDDEIDEILAFIIYYKDVTQPSKQNRDDMIVIYNHITTAESMTWCAMVFDRYGNGVKHGQEYQITEFIRTFYAKVFERLAYLSTKAETSIIMDLTLLSTSSMKKGFISLLAFFRFLKMTLYEKDDAYDVVCENKQSQAKSWVNMQQNFLMEWNAYIEMPTSESNYVWAISEVTGVQNERLLGFE